jgi:pSer/pThr/pTyr-binding forkhead associated (FHA) protein
MGEAAFVKYCPLCGAKNPRQQAFCLKCHDGDLSTVPVEPSRDAAPAPEAAPAQNAGDAANPTLILESVDNPAVTFAIQENQTVGRTDKSQVILRDVPRLEWISGAHARFLRRGGQWYVQHVGSTNFIKVDGETYSGQEEAAVYHGSIVVLSLTSFRVNLEGCAE